MLSKQKAGRPDVRDPALNNSYSLVTVEVITSRSSNRAKIQAVHGPGIFVVFEEVSVYFTSGKT